MCMFSLEVSHVSSTSIFARMLAPGRQLLVYEMLYAAEQPLAMVLPVPVDLAAGEDALQFIDMGDCADFFERVAATFPPKSIGAEGDMFSSDLEVLEQPVLRVQTVGAYEASFVPQPEDFARLDERFRLPLDLWLHLREYRDWGFAVFKLRETKTSRLHPMAFSFQTRHPDRLFFPTLHIHDRRRQPSAAFDHTLYAQPEPAMNWHLQAWEESWGPPLRLAGCEASTHVVDTGFPCWRAVLFGDHENRDCWIGAGAVLPQPAPA